VAGRLTLLCAPSARLRASHCALLTCADAPRLFARLRVNAAAANALRALGIAVLAIGLLIYYGALPPFTSHGLDGTLSY